MPSLKPLACLAGNNDSSPSHLQQQLPNLKLNNAQHCGCVLLFI